MFTIDDALGEIVASSTQPALAAIRLAWWREALERLDRGLPPPEPRLVAASAELLPRGVTGARLAMLEDGWSAQIDEPPDAKRIAARGGTLFALAASLLGDTDQRLDSAGRLFALADGARRGLAPSAALVETATAFLRGHRFARKLRPLTAFARLAARDLARAAPLEPEATPARAVALLAHRLTGIVA